MKIKFLLLTILMLSFTKTTLNTSKLPAYNYDINWSKKAIADGQRTASIFRDMCLLSGIPTPDYVLPDAETTDPHVLERIRKYLLVEPEELLRTKESYLQAQKMLMFIRKDEKSNGLPTAPLSAPSTPDHYLPRPYNPYSKTATAPEGST